MLRGRAGMTHPVRRIGFLLWPGTRPLTLALAEEALRVSQRVHPDVHYELLFLQAEPGADDEAQERLHQRDGPMAQVDARGQAAVGE